MPSKPLRPCNKAGCNELTRERYCNGHKQTNDYDKQRGSAAQRGYGHKWRKYSKAFRATYPICMQCHKAASEHTDHIIAVEGPHDPLFWEPSNHQALCHSCHSRKTVKENGGFGHLR